MKKVLLSVAALFAFGIASAQDKETTGGKGFSNGDVFMTGAIGISSEKQDEVKSTSFEIAPSAGMFVSDNIAVGLRLGFQSTKNEAPATEDEKITSFMVGAFGRYYTTPKNDFSFFAELGAYYMTNKVEQDPAPEFKTNTFGIALTPNISYFVSEHFALEAGFGALSYTNEKPDVDDAEAKNTFKLGLDLTQINFGLTYKF
ncbi:porin family protein [Flavobacterium sp. MAH-1]|uniref:Porin family protein n=1 Tax=Flavobacterium agri TaxID=2743471 RepID=A0A7Y8Y3X6_9FLAO|nr:outer membrane beta-barrel protein [Flavobacterium agri]NUY82062.1 porin family protein [Flavobacterium agri]NYA72086.1 porin family protein [Flavobacterium agri]